MDRRTVCGFFFWMKTLLALVISVGILAFDSYRVYSLYKSGIAAQLASSTITNSTGSENVIAVVNDPTQCYAPTPSVLKNVTGLDGVSHVVTKQNRLEPPDGVRLFGFAINFEYDLPVNITDRLSGRQPGVIAAFVQVTETNLQENMINWYVSETKKINGMLELSLMPNNTLDSFPDSWYDSIATLMYNYNNKYGVPILLRYAHEMNGNWVPYGQRPIAFKKSFQKMAIAVRKQTNMTAMLWGPNPGSGYPYGTGSYSLPANGTDEYKAIDTSGDGTISNADDAYGPYWPGADYVDWVGISMYNYNYSSANSQYITISDSYIRTQLSGPFPDVPQTWNQDFYGRYVDGYNKPFCFTESGAAWVDTPGSKTASSSEIAYKKAWWKKMINYLTTNDYYPNLKIVVNFDEAKYEGAGDDNVIVWKDFQITNKTAVVESFLSDISSVEYVPGDSSAAGPIAWGQSLNFTCNGQMKLKS